MRPAAAAGFETVSGKAGALQALFKASGGGASIDVYRDELPLEVSLAYEPVRDLGLRAAELLAHIPSNELLLAISRGARRVQALPLSSPLMRVAAAVEALMRTAHEWEALAPARYSLADHTARLSSLVTRWRHMELDGWRLLLDRTAHEHCVVTMTKKKLINTIFIQSKKHNSSQPTTCEIEIEKSTTVTSWK